MDPILGHDFPGASPTAPDLVTGQYRTVTAPVAMGDGPLMPPWTAKVTRRAGESRVWRARMRAIMSGK